jgi:hypothetical protein
MYPMQSILSCRRSDALGDGPPGGFTEEARTAVGTQARSRVAAMFRNRERMVKILGVLLAAALALSLVLPFLGSTGP